MDKITHQVRCEQWTSIINECLASGMNKTGYSCAVTPPVRQTGNRLSGPAETAHASLLA